MNQCICYQTRISYSFLFFPAIQSSNTALEMDEYSRSTVSHLLEDDKESFLCKNRLQEYTQRARLPYPVYHTVLVPVSRSTFRSTVVVDGKTYSSLGIFNTKKAAEQDAAAVALESLSGTISNKTADEADHEARTFCKCILHEFATKKHLALPTYETIQLEGTVPVFTSSLVFNGVKYTGEPGSNKKEAEQFAARAVVLSLLGSTGAETPLSETVKSKAISESAISESTYYLRERNSSKSVGKKKRKLYCDY